MTSAGADLLAIVESLDCAFGLERSAKLSPAGIDDDRFLVSLDKEALGPEPRSGLMRIARELALPEEKMELLLAHLADADIIHFGHEGGAGIRKIYLEFAERVGRARAERRPEPQLVHLAVKWRPAAPGSAAVSRYLWRPAERDAERLKERIASFGVAAATTQAALRLLELALARCGSGDIFLMQVEEEGSPRRSFDLNIYAADLTVGDIEPIARMLADAYDIAGDAGRLLARIGGAELGHLSGGLGRDGRDFATLYFGVEARQGRGRG